VVVCALVAVVAGVVEVKAGRAGAGCSCCTGDPVKAGAMVGLGWLRVLLGSVGAGRGIPGGREDIAEALGDDIGVVVEVLPVLPVVALEELLPCAGLDRRAVVEEQEEQEGQADRPLFDDAQGY
jgi:hypothetical protein